MTTERVFKKTTDRLVRIITGKDTIFATPEHPFYVADDINDGSKNGNWMSAGSLKTGLKITLVSGLLANVESAFAFDTLATVYNFEVENTHTYYVGTEGVLVHNQCVSKKQLLALTDEVPNSNNYLSRDQFFTNAAKDSPNWDPELERIVDDIKATRDYDGTKTEAISDRYFKDHYQMTQLDAKVGSNNGLDGLYIKGTVQNPTEIVITESKQWAGTGGVKLSAENTATGLPAQISEQWLRDVAIRLKKTNDPAKMAIASMLENQLNLGNTSIIQKFVIAVDKTNNTTPIYILKLGKY